MNNILPCPLFDNIAWLNQSSINTVTADYLATLAVEAIVDEYMLAKRFLLSYQGSLDTFTSYRREVERFCQWTWLYKKRSIRSIDRHDLSEYFRFVQAPPQSWIAHKHCKRYCSAPNGQRLPNKSWRPFLQRNQHKRSLNHVFHLSQAALRAVIAGTSTFFTFLQQENYLMQNPVLLIRQKNQFIVRNQQHRVTRKLSDLQWRSLVQILTERCITVSKFERHRFIFAAFYLMGLRISELADSTQHRPVMGDFFVDHSGRWWFKTIGKGNKAREIAVSDDMLSQFIRYRRYLSLPDFPTPNESIPLIPKLKGYGGVGVRQLRKLVQIGFDLAIDVLSAQGENIEADRMREATVHWLRHTAISHDVRLRPREHVRDDAGHQSVQITDRYIDIDLHARHASARHKCMVPEFTKTKNS